MKLTMPIRFASEEEKRAFVTACEEDFASRLRAVAQALYEREDVRIIGLCGPSCAGKTTAAQRLSDYFWKHGRRVHTVSIDDFYFDKEILHRNAERNGDGQIDYDSPDTIDLDTLRDFVSGIGQGGLLRCPHFDFAAGKRSAWREIPCEKGDVFLFEGIQVLYPAVRTLLEPYGFVGVYIAPLRALQVGIGREIDPNTLRLMRRVVRDAQLRNTAPAFTFYLWQSVRDNEEKNIFPQISRCEYRVDSTFSYEAGVLKPYLDALLSQVCGEQPARLGALLREIEPISAAYLAEDSLYHEFIPANASPFAT